VLEQRFEVSLVETVVRIFHDNRFVRGRLKLSARCATFVNTDAVWAFFKRLSR
jgi:hypothetical protein